jgi:hypothetical protein
MARESHKCPKMVFSRQKSLNIFFDRRRGNCSQFTDIHCSRYIRMNGELLTVNAYEEGDKKI